MGTNGKERTVGEGKKTFTPCPRNGTTALRKEPFSKGKLFPQTTVGPPFLHDLDATFYTTCYACFHCPCRNCKIMFRIMFIAVGQRAVGKAAGANNSCAATLSYTEAAYCSSVVPRDRYGLWCIYLFLHTPRAQSCCTCHKRYYCMRVRLSNGW